MYTVNMNGGHKTNQLDNCWVYKVLNRVTFFQNCN